MAPHWPEEVDVFSEPHSRMKKLVHKYSKMVSATDFTDECHMTNLLRNLINVFCEFKAHEEIENILIMRNLKRKMKAACVTSAAVCNCHSDNRLTDMLEMVVHGSRSRWTEKSVKERQSYGHKLQKALEDFTENFLPHMEEEEEVFQPMLMQYFSYEELKELKAKVIQEHLVNTNQEKYVEDLCQKATETEPEPCYFDLLPDEICEKVFSHLNPQELGRCAQTCHRWNRLTKDTSLWTGIYPVHWAAGNWTFRPEPLGGVDGDGEFDEALMEDFVDPPVLLRQDEDADVDESSSSGSYDDDKDYYYGDEEPNRRVLVETKILSSLVKHLLPRVGAGVKVVDLAYSRGLNNTLVHKILKLCPNVEVLDLTRTQVGDDAFYEYGVSNRQSKLRHLDLTNCHNITDQTLCSLMGTIQSAVYDDKLNGFRCCWMANREAEEDSDIEIIPVRCRRKQKAINNCCNRLNSKQTAAKCSVDSERLSYSDCCGKELTNSTVMEEVFGKNRNGKCGDSRINGCDTRSDCNVVDSEANGADIRLNNLSLEGDCFRVQCDSGSCTDSVKPLPSGLKEMNGQSSSFERQSLCCESEKFPSLATRNNVSCCRTNSEVLNPILSRSNDHLARKCCDASYCTMQSDLSHACTTVGESDSGRANDTRSSISPLSELRFLSLNGCYAVSDVGLRMLSCRGGTPRLEHLDLSGCTQLTGSSVHQLVSTCGPRFDHANLFYCDNILLDPYPSTASGCRNRGCGGSRFCCSAD